MKNEHLGELSQTVSHMVSHPLQPLSAFRSIKVKIGVLVFGAVITTVGIFWFMLRFGFVWPSVTGFVAAAIALLITRFFASGLTTPLREMAEVSKSLSQGDYTQRVHSNSRDEIGALAQTFNAMASELSKTESLRKELIANASHELKTPLTALQAQLENLVDGIEEPTHAKISALLVQTEHMSALVKQLLDLSKLESGIIELDLNALNISKLLNNAVEVVSANYPNVEYFVSASEASCNGDYHRLVQVFTNLISNAARHCGDDGKVICDVTQYENAISINVHDNGPGIDEEIRPYIFERFYRADTARNSRDGGAGIGLAITKQIVLMHEGKISADSSEKLGGCKIEVSLPRMHKTSTTKLVLPDHEDQDIQEEKKNKETTSWHSIPSTT